MFELSQDPNPGAAVECQFLKFPLAVNGNMLYDTLCRINPAIDGSIAQLG